MAPFTRTFTEAAFSAFLSDLLIMAFILALTLSIVEDKDSYDKFVEEVENFDIELSVDSKISEEQIGNDIFNDER